MVACSTHCCGPNPNTNPDLNPNPNPNLNPNPNPNPNQVGTLVGASSMGAMAVACGIPSAMVTVATLQGAAALFFALRVPRTPVRGPNRSPACAPPARK